MLTAAVLVQDYQNQTGSDCNAYMLARHCAQDNVVLEPMLQILSGVNEGGPSFDISYDQAFDPYTLLPADNNVMIYPGT
jgi:hypothetical protein